MPVARVSEVSLGHPSQPARSSMSPTVRTGVELTAPYRGFRKRAGPAIDGGDHGVSDRNDGNDGRPSVATESIPKIRRKRWRALRRDGTGLNFMSLNATVTINISKKS